MKLFGFEITKSSEDIIQKGEVVLSGSNEGATDLQGGIGAALVQYYDHYLTIPKDEIDLILKYREVAATPEVDKAIDEIVNEAITTDRTQPFYVRLDLDEVDISDTIKDKIIDEFETILRLLKFNRKADYYFRNWYITGRLYHHIVVDSTKLSQGIKKLTYIDPIFIKKYRVVTQDPDQTIKSIEKFYVYTQAHSTINKWDGKNFNEVIKFPEDSINYVTSGLLNPTCDIVLSYLHKAIKPANNLSILEDSVVIYRLVRAPERRVFYIDVGNLPKTKAEDYLNNIMNRYRNKISYDSSTGQLSDGRKQLTMTEDFWLPRREGGKGTEIDTMQGGQNLGEMDDVAYFRKKLQESLNVPESRLNSESLFNIGRSSEITREELKFSKFTGKLLRTFSYGLFSDLLRKQLILKKVIKDSEWEEIEQGIHYVWNKDSYFTEIKSLEVLQGRLEVLDSISQHVAKYFSDTWVRKNVLFQTEEEQDELEKERKLDIELNGEPKDETE